MGRKFLAFLCFFSFFIFLPPTPIKAACHPTVWCSGQISYPCCKGVAAYTCSVSKTSNIPNVGNNCCDAPAECPAGTYPMSSSSWGNPDGVDPFCNAQVGSVRTALGCIPASDPKALVNQIITWTLSLAAGLSLVTLLYAGYVTTTAGGDVKRVHQAREMITSTFLGLAYIVLAVAILNFLGLRILGLGAIGFGV
jgi:hypothetical protein